MAFRRSSVRSRLAPPFLFDAFNNVMVTHSPLKALLDSSVSKAIEEWRLVGLSDVGNVDKILDKIKEKLNYQKT